MLLDKWAGKAWQPVCVISLSAALGSADLQMRLQQSAYQRIVAETHLEPFYRAVHEDVQAALDTGARLFALFAE